MATSNKVGLRSERGPILAAVMLSTALVAVDSTIIATAVPSIVRDIGGFAAFPWLFSIYLLAQAVSVPVYGKLSDLFGRKPVVLWGIGLFLIGSIMCGVAWSMVLLIAFRVVQGLGAGAIMPTTITIVGDLYSVAERARVQGYIASVWGVSSVVGPTLGGVFSEYVSWRWIFFINLPLGAIALAVVVRNMPAASERREHTIDWLGGAVLSVGVTALLLACVWGGTTYPWGSPQVLLTGIGGLALLAAFVAIERRVEHPLLPLRVLGDRTRGGAYLAIFISGIAMFAVFLFLTYYLQQTKGFSPIQTGLGFLPMIFFIFMSST